MGNQQSYSQAGGRGRVEQAPSFHFHALALSPGVTVEDRSRTAVFPPSPGARALAYFNKSLSGFGRPHVFYLRLQLCCQEGSSPLLGFGPRENNIEPQNCEDGFYLWNLASRQLIVGGSPVTTTHLPRCHDNDIVGCRLDMASMRLSMEVVRGGQTCGAEEVTLGSITGEVWPLVGVAPGSQGHTSFRLLSFERRSDVLRDVTPTSQFDPGAVWGEVTVAARLASRGRAQQGNGCVLLNRRMERGLHCWTLQLRCDAGASTCLGVARLPFLPSRAFLEDPSRHIYRQPGLLLWRSYKGLLYVDGVRLERHLEPLGWQAGESIAIEQRLDLTSRTLEFFREGRSLGMAFSDLLGPLAPVVAFYAGYKKEVELVSFYSTECEVRKEEVVREEKVEEEEEEEEKEEVKNMVEARVEEKLGEKNKEAIRRGKEEEEEVLTDAPTAVAPHQDNRAQVPPAPETSKALTAHSSVPPEAHMPSTAHSSMPPTALSNDFPANPRPDVFNPKKDIAAAALSSKPPTNEPPASAQADVLDPEKAPPTATSLSPPTEALGEFCRESLTGQLSLSDDNATLYRSGSQSGNAFCRLGQLHQPGKYHYVFIIQNDQGASTCVGVAREPIVLPDMGNIYASPSMWLFRSFQGMLYGAGAELPRRFDEFWMEATLLEMVVEIEGSEAVVHFSINSQDQGVAFSSIPVPLSPVVGFYASMHKRITLIHFQQELPPPVAALPPPTKTALDHNLLNTSDSRAPKDALPLLLAAPREGSLPHCLHCGTRESNVISLPCQHAVLCPDHVYCGDTISCLVCNQPVLGMWNVLVP